MTIAFRMKATGLKTIRGQLERLKKEAEPGWQDGAASALVSEIKRRAPKDTTQYSKQWKVRRRRNRTKYKTVIHISPGNKKLPGANYGNKTYQDLFGWLEFTGTVKHEIVPRRARMLSWVDKNSGIRRFAMRVMHPGTKPTPHVRPAMRAILPREMQRAIKGIVNRHVWLKR